MPNPSATIPTFLRLLRDNSDEADWLTSDCDWQAFAKACDHHHLAALAFCRVKAMRTPIPPGPLEYLRRRFYEISARNYQLAKEVVDITELFQAHRIPVLAYKGPVVAMAVYGDLTLRQYQDIDLLIHSEHLGKAVRLLTHCGFESAPFSCQPESARQVSRNQEIELLAPQKSYFVDLHWRLAQGRAQAFCPDMEEIWDRAEAMQLPHGRVFAPCREDLFLALCFHGTKHRWARLKWLFDIAEMLRKADNMDWDRIEKTTMRRPLARAALSLAVLLAHDLLDAPLPAAVSRIMHFSERTRTVYSALCEEILTRGYTTTDFEKDLPRLEGSIAAWSSYLYRQYPRSWFVRAVVRVYPQDRAFLPLPEKLDFLYHLVRPLRLVAKHSMRLARKLFQGC
jgi:Uncharacterised nucleotidyltransferase